MKNNNEKKNSRVVTGKVRFAYANLFEPRSNDFDNDKYSISLIIPKSDENTVRQIKSAISSAKQAGIYKFGGVLPESLIIPLKDGDVEKPGDDVYKDSYFISAKSKSKPQVVDKFLNVIKDKNEVYSGCYGRASISFYPYNYKNNKGIACYLGNVQKLEDGERLGHAINATDEFEAYDVELF